MSYAHVLAACPTGDPRCCGSLVALAQLVLSIVALGGGYALLPTPVLGEAWPLEVVRESALYGLSFSTSETIPVITLFVAAALLSLVWTLAVAASRAGEEGGVSLRSSWAVAFCGCWEAVAWTLLLTMLGKSYIGEPRPDFRDRCWPPSQGAEVPLDGSGSSEGVDPDTSAVCGPTTLSEGMVEDGLHSFPSGHASWAAAVGVYLSGLALWSAYSCQSPGLAQRLAFPFFLMPFALALFVGAWHDVLACDLSVYH